MKIDLSILIPSRNEEFLKNTVDDILTKKRGLTEIIVVADGGWPIVPLPDNSDLHIIYHSEAIGQRAATNEAARLSTAEFVMKADAHCKFDEGFDIKMMEDCKDDWTLVPRMYNLHAFNWRCGKCGNETYQGPTPIKCEKCDNTSTFEKVIYWREKTNPTSDFFRFDSDLHFQYWRDFKARPISREDVAPTMSLLGACWMMHRKRYWELDGLDESHGSWGQMGTEIACKSWLSGGSLMSTKKTWFSHLFRTQEGFGFPYPNAGTSKARDYSKEVWFGNKWPKAKYDLKWLVEKFAPVPGWEGFDFSTGVKVQVPTVVEVKEPPKVEEPNSGEKFTKGVVYYTDNRCPGNIERMVRGRILEGVNGHQVISVSQQPIDFGENFVVAWKPSILTMFRQILLGLEVSDADIIFLCEHDVLYHPSHFDFVPPKKDVFYYNENVYQISSVTGKKVYFRAKRLSQICAFRELLLEHYRKRVAIVKEKGFTMRMGFEPGTHRREERVDDYTAEGWMSKFPNVDIKYGKNLTRAKWSPADFRSKRNCKDWKDIEGSIPGWEGLCLIPE